MQLVESQLSRFLRMLPRMCLLLKLSIAVSTLFVAPHASASVTLLLEEPFGTFGGFNPTGHAAIYLDHVCAASYTHLRHCLPDESGVVISRYLGVHGNDWLAVPLVPYLYAVDNLEDAPATVDHEQVNALRERYWSTHLRDLVPATEDGMAPSGLKHGLWICLVGAAYDRQIHAYSLSSTWEQDDRLIETLNTSHNEERYNILFSNCADFAKTILKLYFPLRIGRNFIGDLGVLTPKKVGQAFVKFGRKHADLKFTGFLIPQVQGSVRRSHPFKGIAESIIKSKRYIVPLLLLNPTLAGAAVAGYLTEARGGMPKNLPVIDPRQIASDDLAQARGILSALANQSRQHRETVASYTNGSRDEPAI